MPIESFFISLKRELVYSAASGSSQKNTQSAVGNHGRPPSRNAVKEIAIPPLYEHERIVIANDVESRHCQTIFRTCTGP